GEVDAGAKDALAIALGHVEGEAVVIAGVLGDGRADGERKQIGHGSSEGVDAVERRWSASLPQSAGSRAPPPRYWVHCANVTAPSSEVVQPEKRAATPRASSSGKCPATAAGTC